MMKRVISIATALLFAAIYPIAARGQTYKLTVNINGLHSDNGKVMVILFNHDDGYPVDPDKAVNKTSINIVNEKCTAVFDSLPKGEYAVACFHDENNNGKLDKNFLGMPSEGVGASNNAKGFLGPPKFKDAKFVVETNTTQNISIAY